MRSRFLSGFLGLVAASALLTVAAGCTADLANDRPIIDSVDSPLVVSAENGAYAIPLTILFHDNDGEAVTRIRYRLEPTVDAFVDIPRPNPTRESAEVTIFIPVSACGGRNAHSLEITVVDGRGAESLPLPRNITLQ